MQRQGSALTRVALVTIAVMIFSSMLLTGARVGTSPAQQQADQTRTQLDNLIKHAKNIGIPAAQLQAVSKKELQLSSTTAPFNLFTDQSANDYYSNLKSNYAQLMTQVQGIITDTTDQTRTQADEDLKTLYLTVTQRRNEGLPVDHFTQQYTDFQTLMSKAQYPKDYTSISANAKTSLQSLGLMQQASERLKTFKTAIDQMAFAHIDVSAMQQQYESDRQALAQALVSADFTKLHMQINTQYQQAVVSSMQVMPYISSAKLSELEKQVQLLKDFGYGVDVTPYQKKLDTDRDLMKKIVNLQDFTNFSNQVDADIASMQKDLVRAKARYSVKLYHDKVNEMAKAHPYHDPFDGRDYAYNAGYSQQGVGSDIDLYLSWAWTNDDFQEVTDLVNNTLYNMQMLYEDLDDKTPWDQPHQADLKLLDHYNATKGQVIVVSFGGQALRLYQDGKLVKAYLVTTGRQALPSLPGFWPTANRESPTVFKSTAPKDSPLWYPDTPIKWAILYHRGGYFIHDAWWRFDYGPGTQFPHKDSLGAPHDSWDGSHGCVNLPTANMQWLYANTNFQTKMIMY
jgi:lipoprotein-anchoring transpeptidase ErfK/SrfK